MTKIEELYRQFDPRTPPLTEKEWWDYTKSDLFEFAKLYAEHYAKSCLLKANKMFEWDHDMEQWCGDYKPSEIELPDHE